MSKDKDKEFASKIQDQRSVSGNTFQGIHPRVNPYKSIDLGMTRGDSYDLVKIGYGCTDG
jgi:hypothetical protein